jgi:hypothetical protein
VRFQRRIVRQATRDRVLPSVFGIQLSQASLQFAELLLLSCDLDILPGDLPPRFIPLSLEMLAFPRSPLQTPP